MIESEKLSSTLLWISCRSRRHMGDKTCWVKTTFKIVQRYTCLHQQEHPEKGNRMTFHLKRDKHINTEIWGLVAPAATWYLCRPSQKKIARALTCDIRIRLMFGQFYLNFTVRNRLIDIATCNALVRANAPPSARPASASRSRASRSSQIPS